MTFGFAYPQAFLLFGLVPLWLWWEGRTRPKVRLPSIARIQRTQPNLKGLWLRHIPTVCKMLTLSALIFALARPQSGSSEEKRKTEGLDIMLVIDTSDSMKAMDFEIEGKLQNRMFVIKRVLEEFIQGRNDDRIGMVVFGSEAFAQAPMTLDHDVLQRYLEAIEVSMAGPATAIGDGIGVAINRMKDLTAKQKVMILITDGSNTGGRVDPMEAAKAAHTMGIKIYTIGVGSNGLVPFPTEFGYQRVRFQFDENALKEIAKLTSGRYFRAQDTNALKEVYRTIDALEKSQIEIKTYRHFVDHVEIPLWIALIFLGLDLSLRRSRRMRRVP